MSLFRPIRGWLFPGATQVFQVDATQAEIAATQSGTKTTGFSQLGESTN
jgi:hypothetical protein